MALFTLEDLSTYVLMQKWMAVKFTQFILHK